MLDRILSYSYRGAPWLLSIRRGRVRAIETVSCCIQQLSTVLLARRVLCVGIVALAFAAGLPFKGHLLLVLRALSMDLRQSTVLLQL